MDGVFSAASHGRVSARPGGAVLLKMPQAPAGQIIPQAAAGETELPNKLEKSKTNHK